MALHPNGIHHLAHQQREAAALVGVHRIGAIHIAVEIFERRGVAMGFSLFVRLKFARGQNGPAVSLGAPA